jgi:hypothetical protein
MNALPAALAAQRALIEARRAERITELRHHDAACFLCGDGPTDGRELRMLERDQINMAPEMVCAKCVPLCDLKANFADLPMVWPVMKDANR